MKKYIVNVEWIMTKTIEVEANNKDEAYQKAMTYDTSNGEYIEDSYEAYVQED